MPLRRDPPAAPRAGQPDPAGQGLRPPYPPALLVPPYPPECHRYFSLADRHPFAPADADPSLVHGWWLAEAATLAYHTFQEIEANLAPFVRKVVPIGEDTPRGTPAASADARVRRELFTGEPVRARGYVASGDGFTLAVFCGTEFGDARMLPRDLLIDLDPRLPAAPGWTGGRVHPGFDGALEAVWDQVAGALDPPTAGGGSRVWFAGHSLGAAVATLAAARWHLRAPERPKTLYTFAPPRVGDAAFAAVCEDGFPVFRYVHDRDMVARVPPTVDRLGLTYRDVGRGPVYFRDDGSPAPATDFLTELRRAAPDAALKAARMVLSGRAFAAFRGGWRAIAEALAEGAPQTLVDHAPIYYINYFKAQLA